MKRPCGRWGENDTVGIVKYVAMKRATYDMLKAFLETTETPLLRISCYESDGKNTV